MSKHQNIAASIGIKLVRKFSFLAILVLGILFSTTGDSFAVDCNDPQFSNDSSCTGIPVTCGDPDIAWDTSCGGNGVDPGFGAVVPNADPGNAANTSIAGVAKIICEVVFVLIFDIGRGIATLSIIALGIAAMFGKATWTQAVTVAAGIGIMYGGMTLVTILTLNLTNLAGTNYACLAVLVGDVANMLR